MKLTCLGLLSSLTLLAACGNATSTPTSTALAKESAARFPRITCRQHDSSRFPSRFASVDAAGGEGAWLSTVKISDPVDISLLLQQLGIPDRDIDNLVINHSLPSGNGCTSYVLDGSASLNCDLTTGTEVELYAGDRLVDRLVPTGGLVDVETFGSSNTTELSGLTSLRLALGDRTASADYLFEYGECNVDLGK